MAAMLSMEVKEAPKAMAPARRAKGAGNAGSVKRRRRRKTGATANVETKSAAATLRKKPWRRKEWMDRRRQQAQKRVTFAATPD